MNTKEQAEYEYRLKVGIRALSEAVYDGISWSDWAEDELKTKPLTIICHPETVQVEPRDDRFEIAPPTTVTVADNLTCEQWDTIRAEPWFINGFKAVFSCDPPIFMNSEWPVSFRHVTGLLIMLWHAQQNNLHPWVRFPETYLHPKSQLGLADVFVMFSLGGV